MQIITSTLPHHHLIECLDGIRSARDLLTFAELGLEAVRLVVSDANYYSITSFTSDFRQMEIFHPGEGWLPQDHGLVRKFSELAIRIPTEPPHPSLQAFLNSGQSDAFLRSQLVDDRQWRQSMHYQLVDREMQIEDMASVFLGPFAGRVIAFHCGSNRQFQPALLAALKPLARVIDCLFPESLKSGPVERIDAPPGENRSALLTRREMEVMYWLDQGNRNAEIAKILGLSPGTVRRHLQNIFLKLGVNTRTAALKAVRGDLRPPTTPSGYVAGEPMAVAATSSKPVPY